MQSDKIEENMVNPLAKGYPKPDDVHQSLAPAWTRQDLRAAI